MRNDSRLFQRITEKSGSAFCRPYQSALGPRRPESSHPGRSEPATLPGCPDGAMRKIGRIDDCTRDRRFPLSLPMVRSEQLGRRDWEIKAGCTASAGIDLARLNASNKPLQ